MSHTELGKKLSELRRKKGLSQEKLAEMLDVSRQAVTKWESGKSNPDTENLILIAEIFDVSLDELCLPEKEKKTKASIHIGGHILAVLSVLITAAYCIIGGITGNFSGEVLMLLLIMAFPMHVFLHLVFWGMVKSGEFSMLAGYDSSIKYDTEEMKRYIAGLDFMLGLETASYIFMVTSLSLIAPQFHIIPILLGGYILSFVAGILFMGYKFGDRIYVDPKDAERARRSSPSSITVLGMILLSVGVFIAAFELKGYENNTLKPFPMLGMMFLSIILALIGYLIEQNRIKKADEHAPFFGRAFIVLNGLALLAMVLMAFL